MSTAKRIGLGLVVITAITVIVLAQIALGIPATAQDAPVLVNPGLEGEYTPFEGVGELKVPFGSRPWWTGRRPEYLPGDIAHTGTAQKVFTTYSAQDSGLYQQVAVTPGQWYRLTAWVFMRSTGNSGGSSAMVCINPWARWDIEHRTTVCGREDVARYNEWVQVEVTAQAFTDRITVATRGIAQWAVAYNDFFWDDLSLEQVTIGGTCPTPAPTATVAPVPTGEAGECATIGEIEALLRGMKWGVK